MSVNDGIGKTDFKTDSFLMIGQSNMAGRGDFGEVPEIVNDKCFMLRMGRWQFMSEPINPDRYIFGGGFHSGISLAASFANEYAGHFNRQVGLIPCADGGTTVTQWQPGSILFDHCVMQAKLAMRSSELRGILWHQGESDCDSDENLEMYEERVRRVLCGIREQLGMSQEQLAEKMGYSSRSSINKIEKGRPCSQKIIARLAEALNVSIPYLMGWEEKQAEAQKKGSTIADAALRMKTDSEFMSVVEMLLPLDNEKISDVKNLISLFLK